MKITIIGLGLIGGSFGLTLKARDNSTWRIGVDDNPDHCAQALTLGLVDEIHTIDEAIKKSDLIILATPVHAIEKLLPTILDEVENQVVMDAGSTKDAISKSVKNHPKRSRFVATHPMWGTEFSGPSAAMPDAFRNKATVICDKEGSDADAVKLVEDLYRELGMHIIYMNSDAHDIHVAYVSHISHITSFALANTVLEKEREEDTIFELASGGFESTVRLAKSNPLTWASIFMQNRDNVLDVLNEHIHQLKKFKACLEKENLEYLEDLMVHANDIKRILK